MDTNKNIEHLYYDKDGNLIVALGTPIEDILETDSIKDKRIRELETSLTQSNFMLSNAEAELELYKNSVGANVSKSLYEILQQIKIIAEDIVENDCYENSDAKAELILRLIEVGNE